MVFLMETRLKLEEATAVKNKTKFGECLAIECTGSGKERARELLLLWNDKFKVSISSSSLNHIKGSILEGG